MSQFDFEDKYPAIAEFIEGIGWIEIGIHEILSCFVRAYDLGGTVYEGKNSYPSMEAALQDLNQGIADYMDENGLWEDS